MAGVFGPPLGSEFSDFRRFPAKKNLDLKLTLTFSIREWDVANPILEKAMRNNKGRFQRLNQRSVAAAVLGILIAGSGAIRLRAQSPTIVVNGEKRSMTTESKFYCKLKALTPEQRARHKQLSVKLIAERREIVETDKGYEFQFSPRNVSVTELAEWVAAESKCCPFFDFHIDVEREGNLLCLRLTGEEGVKAFIRSEFEVH